MPFFLLWSCTRLLAKRFVRDGTLHLTYSRPVFVHAISAVLLLYKPVQTCTTSTTNFHRLRLFMHKCSVGTWLTWSCKKKSENRLRLINYSICALFIYCNCTSASATSACIDTCLIGLLCEIGGVHTKMLLVTSRV